MCVCAEPSLHRWDPSHLVSVSALSDMFWVLFAAISLGTSASVFIKEIGLQVFHFVVSMSGSGIEVKLALEDLGARMHL